MYLAHPAGMLHGQATAGHGCSHISFQIHHNSSHRVQASGTIFLTLEKGENKIDGKRMQTDLIKHNGLECEFEARQKEAKTDKTAKF